MGATTDGYDGIPYDELSIDAVEVRPDQEQHLARRQRTGASMSSWSVSDELGPGKGPGVIGKAVAALVQRNHTSHSLQPVRDRGEHSAAAEAAVQR